jgi:hypothetical protein
MSDPGADAFFHGLGGKVIDSTGVIDCNNMCDYDTIYNDVWIVTAIPNSDFPQHHFFVEWKILEYSILSPTQYIPTIVTTSTDNPITIPFLYPNFSIEILAIFNRIIVAIITLTVKTEPIEVGSILGYSPISPPGVPMIIYPHMIPSYYSASGYAYYDLITDFIFPHYTFSHWSVDYGIIDDILSKSIHLDMDSSNSSLLIAHYTPDPVLRVCSCPQKCGYIIDSTGVIDCDYLTSKSKCGVYCNFGDTFILTESPNYAGNPFIFWIVNPGVGQTIEFNNPLTIVINPTSPSNIVEVVACYYVPNTLMIDIITIPDIIDGGCVTGIITPLPPDPPSNIYTALPTQSYPMIPTNIVNLTASKIDPIYIFRNWEDGSTDPVHVPFNMSTNKHIIATFCTLCEYGIVNAGSGSASSDYILPSSVIAINIYVDMYGMPDTMIVTGGGSLNTGSVQYTGLSPYYVPIVSPNITIEIIGGGAGTAWEYRIECVSKHMPISCVDVEYYTDTSFSTRFSWPWTLIILFDAGPISNNMSIFMSGSLVYTRGVTTGPDIFAIDIPTLCDVDIVVTGSGFFGYFVKCLISTQSFINDMTFCIVYPINSGTIDSTPTRWARDFTGAYFHKGSRLTFKYNTNDTSSTTYTAIPNVGWNFKYWYDCSIRIGSDISGGGIISYNNVLVVPMSSPVTYLGAYFEV